MMRQRQTIVKTLAAVAIAFGMQTPAQAQFGGLLKKAKQAVKEKVDDAKSSAKQQAQGAANGQVQQAQGQPGQTDQATQNYINQLQTQHDDANLGDFEQRSDGSYWIWQSSGFGTRHYGQSKIFGKWYPNERKMVAGDYIFTIDQAGKVFDKDGNLKGAVQKNRIVTANAEILNLQETESAIHIIVGGKDIAQVTKDGRCMFGTDLYAQAGPIDQRAYAFLLFGLQYSNEELLALAAKREQAVKDTEVELANHQEFAEFSARVTRMAVRENVEKNGMSARMDERDYYIYNQTNNLNRGCHWVMLDNVRVCGWNPENNHLLDRDYNRLGTFSGGVLYDRWGVKYGSVQNGVVKNRHGKMVGKAVKGQFKGTAFGGKDKDFNYKLVDAGGKQVGLIQTNASPDLVAAWAFCMFAKK